jgi:hypothetical protein
VADRAAYGDRQTWNLEIVSTGLLARDLQFCNRCLGQELGFLEPLSVTFVLILTVLRPGLSRRGFFCGGIIASHDPHE